LGAQGCQRLQQELGPVVGDDHRGDARFGSHFSP
jgi:hypothetical protein